MLITDEMVERGAEAAWESLRHRTLERSAEHGEHGEFDMGPFSARDEALRQDWRDDTRAALEAALIFVGDAEADH